MSLRGDVRVAVREAQEIAERGFQTASRKNRRIQEHPSAVRKETLRYLITLGVEGFLELLAIPPKDGMEATPARVARAWQEMTSGYAQDPAEILSTRFRVPYDEIVVVKGIRFTSVCEHHILPFVGTMDVGYLPSGSVVGLSKIPRLVEALAHRLQVQERLTMQVADALVEHLEPRGVGVVCDAKHQCMGCRGVRQPDASMITSAMRGEFLDSPAQRAEFLALLKGD